MVLLVALAVSTLALPADPYAEKVKPTLSWKAGSARVQMALSSDGSTVATIDPATGTVSTWDAATGRLVATLGTHPGGEYPKVSADGRLVATVSKDRKLRVWTRDGSPNAAAILHLATRDLDFQFAGSGHRLAFSTDQGLAIYDADTRKTTVTARYRLPERFILQTGPRGAEVVIADTPEEDSGFYLWNGVAGRKVLHAPLGRQVTNFVAPVTDRSLLYQGIEFDPNSGFTAPLYAFDVATRKSRKLFAVQTGRNILTFLYFDPKGRQVCWQHYPGQPSKVLARLPGVGVRTYLEAEEDKRLDVYADAAGKTVATVGEDGIVRIWRLAP